MLTLLFDLMRLFDLDRNEIISRQYYQLIDIISNKRVNGSDYIRIKFAFELKLSVIHIDIIWLHVPSVYRVHMSFYSVGTFTPFIFYTIIQ